MATGKFRDMKPSEVETYEHGGRTCKDFAVSTGSIDTDETEHQHVVIVMDGSVFPMRDREDVEEVVRALRGQADIAWPKPVGVLS